MKRASKVSVSDLDNLFKKYEVELNIFFNNNSRLKKVNVNKIGKEYNVKVSFLQDNKNRVIENNYIENSSKWQIFYANLKGIIRKGNNSKGIKVRKTMVNNGRDMDIVYGNKE